MFTGQKFEISFLFGSSLSKGTTEATFAFPGDVLCLTFTFTAFNKYGVIKFEASFSSIGRIMSVPTTVFSIYILEYLFNVIKIK